MLTYSLVNQFNSSFDNELQTYCIPYGEYLNKYVNPFWQKEDCKFIFVPFSGTTTVAPSGTLPMFFRDRCIDPGALGYHDKDESIEAVIGVLDCREYNVPVSSVGAHEAAEMHVDPDANSTVVVNGVTYMLEVCDPVEGDLFELAGVKVSNFVTPLYFNMKSVDNRLDVMNKLSVGCPHLTPGGYIEYLENNQWVQSRKAMLDGKHSYMSNRTGRSMWRRLTKNV